MTAENAIRWLHFEAARCRSRDACEAFCLLMPSLMKIHGLEPMEEAEATAFRFKLKSKLDELQQFQDATDQADAASPVLVQGGNQ